MRAKSVIADGEVLIVMHSPPRGARYAAVGRCLRHLAFGACRPAAPVLGVLPMKILPARDYPCSQLNMILFTSSGCSC